MQIPPEMRRRPPPSTLAWAAQQVGANARVVRVRRLRNAWASAVHAIDVDDGENAHRLVLRRWARTDLPPDDGVVANEAAVLSYLAAADVKVPVPRLIGADPDAEHADVPALLMSRVEGRDVLTPSDLDAYLRGLATTLRSLHAVAAPDASIVADYRPWDLDMVTAPPDWAPRRDIWARASEIMRSPVPPHEPVFLHRDYHPGNVLWRRGRVSGVVDWSHGCRGPVAADVAHCRMNLAVLFGPDVADEFARRYGAVGDLAWHDIAVVVGAAAYGPLDVWRWHDAGRVDVTTAGVIDAHSELLARAISRLS